MLLAHVFYNAAIVVRIVGGSLSSLDPRLVEAARTLGAGRFRSFMRVTVRLLLPSIAASTILVFAFCFSSFGVILVLGGPRMGTLETEIYRQAVSFFNLPAAAMLSAIQLAATRPDLVRGVFLEDPPLVTPGQPIFGGEIVRRW